MSDKTFDHEAVRLGKLEVKKDRRNLKFAKYLPKKLTPPLTPPSKVQRIKLVPEWPMFGNDEYGDCTCVAVGYTEMLDSAAASQEEVPTLQQIMDLYWATGDPPNQPSPPGGATDTGRYCLDVLKYWQHNGVGPEGTKLLAYCQIDPKNHTHVKLAIDLFGSVYAGVALPISAQAQVDTGVWRVTRGADAAPGSWGGHCIGLFDYSSRSGPACVTWTREQRMTWGWWDKYADEAYAPISQAWFDAQGQAPGGFNLDQLLKDLDRVQS